MEKYSAGSTLHTQNWVKDTKQKEGCNDPYFLYSLWLMADNLYGVWGMAHNLYGAWDVAHNLYGAWVYGP